MRILAIETSCDETAVCVIEASGTFESDFSFRILGNALFSQVKIHEKYGGVFPNMAKREHQINLVPLLTQALQEAKLLENGTSPYTGVDEILSRETELIHPMREFLAQHAAPEIDCIAVTHGPGLEPALWVGINFAKALSLAWNKPLVPVNHMEGHITLSAMENGKLAAFQFPLLSLLISGAHTELVLSREFMQYEILGQTRDDAVGEAFDKVARLLDLPYPGGPQISRLASEARSSNIRVYETLILPRPMIDSKEYDFSFSGLKTAVRRIVEAHQPLSGDMKKEIAREFEDACADVLVAKTMRAIDECGARTVLVGGGVSANTHIRMRLAETIKESGFDSKLLIPPPELATDNAIMIALAGYFRAIKNEFPGSETMQANGNLKLK